MPKLWKRVLNYVGSRYQYYNEWEWALIDGYSAVSMTRRDRFMYELCTWFLRVTYPRTVTESTDDLTF